MKTAQGKTDLTLGQDVHNYLVELGLETPLSPAGTPMPSVLANSTLRMLQEIGLDLNDDSLKETPARVAKMWLNEIFWGLDYGNFPKAMTIENKMRVDEMVVIRNISVMSFCEHHLLPIIGYAHVAYIPDRRVPGLSKINRLVEFFSRRPQVQERLTSQIASTLEFLLNTPNVAVFIEAEHMCVKMRGVEDGCSNTATSKLSGSFRRPEVRAEFLSIVQQGKIK